MATTDDEGPPRSVSEQGRRFPPPASISVETLPPTPLVVDDRRRVVKYSMTHHTVGDEQRETLPNAETKTSTILLPTHSSSQSGLISHQGRLSPDSTRRT